MGLVLRHALGFVVGIGIFYVAFPAALLALARHVDPELGVAVTGLRVTRSAIAIGLAIVGIAFAVSSNLWLLLVGRGGPADGFGLAVSPRTAHLVTTGPYALTRNPMAFGTCLVYLALVVALGSPSGLLMLALVVIILAPYLRLAEEKRLLEDFGEQYESYRDSTPFLLPRPPRQDAGRAHDGAHGHSARAGAWGVLGL